MPTWQKTLDRLLMWFVGVTVLAMILATAVVAYPQPTMPPDTNGDRESGTVLDPPGRLGTPQECAKGDSETPRRDAANNELICPDDNPNTETRGSRPDLGSPPPPTGGPDSSQFPPSGGTIPPSPPTDGPLPGGPPSGGTIPPSPPTGGTGPSTPPTEEAAPAPGS
jgi:elongation factor 1-delta